MYVKQEVFVWHKETELATVSSCSLASNLLGASSLTRRGPWNDTPLHCLFVVLLQLRRLDFALFPAVVGSNAGNILPSLLDSAKL